MNVLPLSPAVRSFAKKRSLEKKLGKQLKLLASNPKHPSLHVELLVPKNLHIYSFRVDIKYRALFIYRDDLDAIEILTLTTHYD